METTRILNPPRTVDPYYRQAERMAATENRLALLERQAGGTTKKFERVLSSATTSTVILPAVDGQNITGVRLTGQVLTASATSAYLRLRPNGLSSMVTNAIGDLIYIADTPTYSPTEQGQEFGGGVVSSPGVVVAVQRYGTAINTLVFDGVFFTRTGVYRVYQGDYTAVDGSTDSNRMARGRVSSQWHDATTAITSLTLALDFGTFTGVVTTEII